MLGAAGRMPNSPLGSNEIGRVRDWKTVMEALWIVVALLIPVCPVLVVAALYRIPGFADWPVKRQASKQAAS